MSGDHERTRQAREAYEIAQREAARLAIEASQVAAAENQARIAQNVQQVSGELEAALARLQAQGFPGVRMVPVDAEVRRGIFRTRQSVAVEEPGWEVYSFRRDVAGRHSEDVFLLADGTFVRMWSYMNDGPGSREGYDRLSPTKLATLDQKLVDGVVHGMESLAPAQ